MADIVLRDRSGNPVEYPGIEKIKLNTVDGEAVEFVNPELLGVKIATGTFTGTTGTVTISHNLGVVPDLILVFPSSYVSGQSNYSLLTTFGFSSAFKEKNSAIPGTIFDHRTTTTDFRTGVYTNCVDDATDSARPSIIREANAETFLVGTNLSNYPIPIQYVPYRWVAIGGLT